MAGPVARFSYPAITAGDSSARQENERSRAELTALATELGQPARPDRANSRNSFKPPPATGRRFKRLERR